MKVNVNEPVMAYSLTLTLTEKEAEEIRTALALNWFVAPPFEVYAPPCTAESVRVLYQELETLRFKSH